VAIIGFSSHRVAGGRQMVPRTLPGTPSDQCQVWLDSRCDLNGALPYSCRACSRGSCMITEITDATGLIAVCIPPVRRPQYQGIRSPTIAENITVMSFLVLCLPLDLWAYYHHPITSFTPVCCEDEAKVALRAYLARTCDDRTLSSFFADICPPVVIRLSS
jgi:hypothetical protein